MAITELIFPALKTDHASIEEVERDWPSISKRLTDPNPGLLNAFRGWIVAEDAQGMRDANKEFLIFEWDQADSFHAFVVSEQFAAFASSIKHLVTGPPTLQLFDTNLSPRDAASAPVVEVIRVGVSNADNVEASLQAWENISRYLAAKHGEKVSITYGKSSNLENDVVAGIVGWQSLEDRAQVSQEEAFVEMLGILKSLGEVSQIIVDIAPEELVAL